MLDEDPVQDELQQLAVLLYRRYSMLMSPAELQLTRFNQRFYMEHTLILDAPGLSDAQRLRFFPALSGYVAPPTPASAYDYLPINHWAYSTLEELTESGVLDGYPEHFFDGSRMITRYEFAQAVARLNDTVGFAAEPDEIQTQCALLILEFKDQLAETHCFAPIESFN